MTGNQFRSIRPKSGQDQFLLVLVLITLGHLLLAFLEALFSTGRSRRSSSGNYWKKFDWDVDGIKDDADYKEERDR